MDFSNDDVLKVVDHTLLKVTSKKADFEQLCEEAIQAGVFSVCVPPDYVSFCKSFLMENNIKVCTVVGFPSGYSTSMTKVFEAEDALKNGADEIDMVANIGFVKDSRYKEVRDEIFGIKKICGEKVLKVIIETCYLTDEEKRSMCEVIIDSGADYIKTSTGFGTSGANFEDVKLIKDKVKDVIKVKVAGGISDFGTAKKYLELGADRIGSSSLAKILKLS